MGDIWKIMDITSEIILHHAMHKGMMILDWSERESNFKVISRHIYRSNVTGTPTVPFHPIEAAHTHGYAYVNTRIVKGKCRK